MLLTLLLSATLGDFPTATPEEVGLDPARIRTISETARRWVERDQVAGLILLIIKDRRTVLHEAWGFRDRAEQSPMLPDTICNIRSMTKSFTGVAIQLLIEDGVLDLDCPVADYLDGFAGPAEDITIDHLLTHRSGLPVTVINQSMTEYPSLVALASEAGSRPLRSTPGGDFWYSDAGTEVLGALVEVASDQRLDAFVTERILEPLQLSDTFYDLDPQAARRDRLASGYAGGQHSWTRFWSPDDGPLYPFAWGSQSLYSTTTDFARFLAFLLDGGVVGGEPVLGESLVEQMLTPAARMTAIGSGQPQPTSFADLECWYGQMSMLYCDAGDATGEPPSPDSVVAFGHGGSDGTMGWAFPAHDLIGVVFTQSRGQATILGLEPLLQQLIDPNAAARAEVPAEFSEYFGHYVANFGQFRNAEFTVLAQNGRLALDLAGRGVFEFDAPDERGHWIGTGQPRFELTFNRDDSGRVSSLVFHSQGRRAVCPRGEATAEPAIDRSAVEALLGVYSDSDSETEVRVLVHEDRLTVRFPGTSAPLPLGATGDPLIWFLRANPGIRLRFQRDDESGEITSYAGTLPDGSTVIRHRIKE